MKMSQVLIVDKQYIQQIRKYLETQNIYDNSKKILIKEGKAEIPLLDDLQVDSLSQNIKENFGFTPSILTQNTKDSSSQKSNKTKLEILSERIKQEIGNIPDIPKSFEIYDDLILLPSDALKSDFDNENVYEIICDIFRVKRIARKNAVVNDKFRSPRTDILLGSDPWVFITENKIKYRFNITKSMFCRGNITEKLRIAKFDCYDEVVVDLFAGIGYFSLPYLVHAHAKHVYAVEWNPNSVEALKLNLQEAKVDDRCTVLLGDNREVTPLEVADRVNLGLIPTSEISWKTAILALKPSGGVLHVHQNVEVHSSISKMEAFSNFGAKICDSIMELLKECKNGEWRTKLVHTECVKSYAPRIYHMVYDIECRPLA